MWRVMKRKSEQSNDDDYAVVLRVRVSLMVGLRAKGPAKESCY